MAGYQIFAPGSWASPKAALDTLGLPDFVDEAKAGKATFRDLPDLPGETTGILIYWGSSHDSDADQSGKVFLPLGDHYVVFSADQPLTADGIAKRQLFSGSSYRMPWEPEISGLPVAELNLEIPLAAMLPATKRLVDKRWVSVRKPMFDEFWNASAVWFKRWAALGFSGKWRQEMAGEDIDDEKLDQEMAQYVVMALRQNYRLYDRLVSALGLLDMTALYAVCGITISGMEIREVLDLKEKLEFEMAEEDRRLRAVGASSGNVEVSVPNGS